MDDTDETSARGEIPYYERTLDSFEDDIIVRAIAPKEDGHLWYTVLDTGFESYVSDPDFAWAGSTRDVAIRDCAARIRADARGIGKFAPHSLLRTDGYDFHFRLCRHWMMKEQLRELGQDPNEVINEIRGMEERWKLAGNWVYRGQNEKTFEFRFRWASAVMEADIRGGMSEAEAMNKAETSVFGISRRSIGITQETRELLNQRLGDIALGIEPEVVPAGPRF